MCIEFPKVLDLIRQDDASFEKSVSSSIQKLKLYHKDSTHNPNLGQHLNSQVTKSIGILIVNTRCLTRKYEPGIFKSSISQCFSRLKIESEIKVAKRMFRELQVDEVQVLEDKNKYDLMKHFHTLKFESEQFKK